MTSTAKFAFAHDSEKHLDPQQISLLEKETVTKEPNIEVPLEPSGDKRKETPFETAVLDAYIKGGSTIDQIVANMGIEEKDVVDVLSGYAAGKFRNRHFSPALHDRVVDFARYVHLEGGNVWQDLRKLEGWVEDLIVTYAKEWATSRNKIRVHRRRTINDEKGRLVSDYEVEMTYGEGGRTSQCTQ